MSRRRDHQAEHRRRVELAKELGFASPRERKRASRLIRTRRDLEALPPKAREVRASVLRAVSIMRTDNVGANEAARLAGTTTTAIRVWAPAVVRSGRVTLADRLLRPLRIYAAGESVEVDVRGSRVASIVGVYHSAIRTYLNTGDVSELRRFEGKRVAGRILETDPDTLDEMARRGTFRLDHIYVLAS